MIPKKSKIYIASYKGLVGSAILRKLKAKGYKNIIIADKSKLDLTNQLRVHKFIKKINSYFFSSNNGGGFFLIKNIKQFYL